MVNQESDDEIIYDLQRLKEIDKISDLHNRINLDVTPKVVMEPRYQANAEDLKKLSEIAGYMFYVESETDPPALMLMKIGKTDISLTIGKIDEIPANLIQDAIANPVHPPVHGMYAITETIKAWLRKELNL